ncbi:MAG: hypothetical protein M1828_004913 [Chrysothrix sp. TS-e1954]|nr:MAG: hypothetical protein M1828_004913 [Chrysothrix sp. TS-e1954]
MDVYYNIPPITRSLVTATVALSVAVHASIISLYRVAYLAQQTFWSFPPEIWRPFTSFFITGGGLSLLMDPYFLYLYADSLEREGSRFSRKEDFAWYILFNMAVIFVLSNLTVGGFLFLRPLLLALAYTFAQDNPRRRVYIAIVPIQARFLPYAMLAISFVMGGPTTMLMELPGLLSAHLFNFLTRIWPTYGGGRKWIETPVFMRKLFAESRAGPTTRGYGTAYQARTPSASSSGWSSGWAGSVGSRGTGRRLGGD